MMRLWKGLHYCFWMSDKPLVQEELAEAIGSMVTRDRFY
jgi:ribosomal RNA-processing protein 1